MPSYKIHNLFPTLLYQNNIPVKKEWIEYAENSSMCRMPIGNGDFTENKNVLDDLKDLKQEIHNCVNQYVFDYMKVSDNQFELTILNSWINRHNSGDWAQSHFHGNSIISGVYYLKTNNSTGQISFNRPAPSGGFLTSSFYFNLKELTEYNCDNYTLKPEDGDILLFPSHLEHSVGKNESIDTRYSLAFNVFFKGTIGKNEHELTVH